MDAGLFLALAAGTLLAFFVAVRLRRRYKQRRRERLRARPLPQGYIRILQKNVPLYDCLPERLQADLHANINVFLDEKEFYGRGGLEVTDEMRLTVAANACMLLLNRPNDCFPGFQTILLYPQTYSASEQQSDGLVVSQEHSHRAGESWHRGPVVLAWSDVLYGSRVRGDGFNVVLHEFAHKLDEATPAAGVPQLGSGEQYQQWAQVFSASYERFLDELETREDETIDDYGATSPEEFFAVCTESFFEKPRLMQRDWPDLYRQLAGFYQVDPASWQAGINRE